MIEPERFNHEVNPPDNLYEADNPGRPKPEPNKKPMKKVFKVIKRFGSIIGGVATGGGSILAGFDPSTALLVAGCTVALILGVEVATIKEFKEIFDKGEEK